MSERAELKAAAAAHKTWHEEVAGHGCVFCDECEWFRYMLATVTDEGTFGQLSDAELDEWGEAMQAERDYTGWADVEPPTDEGEDRLARWQDRRADR